MSTIEYIRNKVFKMKQAPFAEIAGVSQPTISRWEEEKQPGSQPNREEMERIRTAAIARGLPWNDSWFFEAPASDKESAA